MDSNTHYYSPLAPSGSAAAATTTATASPTPSSPERRPPQAIDSAETLLATTTTTTATKADKGKNRLHNSTIIAALKSTLRNVSNWTRQEKQDERPRVRIDEITGETLDGWEVLR
ncbi:hypothetical protein AC579_4765 [Pseudocercospora musae]|uniref:Uncharacterized protein n=1 Tax=Pseudocercospora musae TaxID=113226 RepID=A0A139IQL8_9PEZI|nr:hypothetical protein AC579_4765 [Pseudocercospora musae]